MSPGIPVSTVGVLMVLMAIAGGLAGSLLTWRNKYGQHSLYRSEYRVRDVLARAEPHRLEPDSEPDGVELPEPTGTRELVDFNPNEPTERFYNPQISEPGYYVHREQPRFPFLHWPVDDIDQSHSHGLPVDVLQVPRPRHVYWVPVELPFTH